ncbi:hypothetical protein [Arenimonas sp.]|uniref:phage fiber-tail adaptor protein n=1 Tax=Arenimonas sp. TaxID=1872635 RepID=UPI0025B82C75|nr:hypothetical protein [Arenimonas sp.]
MSPQLPDKDSEESFVFAFDFLAELAGSTVVSAVVSVSCVQGTDAAPAAMLVGALAIDGADVLQLVQGGIDGNTYKLRCVATLANGQRRVRAALLPIRAA